VLEQADGGIQGAGDVCPPTGCRGRQARGGRQLRTNPEQQLDGDLLQMKMLLASRRRPTELPEWR
jgi:hypothetical protein